MLTACGCSAATQLVGPSASNFTKVPQTHKSPAAEKATPATGAGALPNLKPIEKAFAKLKAHLRARAIRTIDALWQAIGLSCDLFEPAVCKNYFAAAAYGFI